MAKSRGGGLRVGGLGTGDLGRLTNVSSAGISVLNY